MPPDASTPHMLDLVGWLSRHPVAGVWIGAFFLWVSVALIIRMWFIHRRASFLNKLVWSFVLLIPLFGWLLYSGLFRVPTFTDVQCPTEHSADAPCIGGDHF
jgi:hypothetical protein